MPRIMEKLLDARGTIALIILSPFLLICVMCTMMAAMGLIFLGSTLWVPFWELAYGRMSLSGVGIYFGVLIVCVIITLAVENADRTDFVLKWGSGLWFALFVGVTIIHAVRAGNW